MFLLVWYKNTLFNKGKPKVLKMEHKILADVLKSSPAVPLNTYPRVKRRSGRRKLRFWVLKPHDSPALVLHFSLFNRLWSLTAQWAVNTRWVVRSRARRSPLSWRTAHYQESRSDTPENRCAQQYGWITQNEVRQSSLLFSSLLSRTHTHAQRSILKWHCGLIGFIRQWGALAVMV